MVPGSSKLVQLSMRTSRTRERKRFPWVIKYHTNCLLQSHLLACTARDQKVMGIWCLWREHMSF